MEIILLSKIEIRVILIKFIVFFLILSFTFQDNKEDIYNNELIQSITTK